jgi:hypothetical protein
MATLQSAGFAALHRSAFAYAHSVFPDEIDAFARMVTSVDAPAGSPASTYIRAAMSGVFRTAAGYGCRDVRHKQAEDLQRHVRGESNLGKLLATPVPLNFFRTHRERMAEP